MINLIVLLHHKNMDEVVGTNVEQQEQDKRSPNLLNLTEL